MANNEMHSWRAFSPRSWAYCYRFDKYLAFADSRGLDWTRASLLCSVRSCCHRIIFLSPIIYYFIYLINLVNNLQLYNVMYGGAYRPYIFDNCMTTDLYVPLLWNFITVTHVQETCLQLQETCTSDMLSCARTTPCFKKKHVTLFIWAQFEN